MNTLRRLRSSLSALCPVLLACGLAAAPSQTIRELSLTTPLGIGYGGTGAALSDPNADRIPFWDDSAGAVTWLTVGSGLSITGTTLSNSLSFTDSSGLRGALSDETGTGAAVFGTSPTFTTQITAPKLVWTGSVQDLAGSGSPESAVTAAVGSVYRRTDGGTATTLYLKESGSGNTGWVPVGGSGGGAPSTATYLTQTADGTLSAEQALSSLSTGLMQVTTSTGAVTSVTTSAGVSGLLSDETGSGALVFGTAPTISSLTFGSNSITGSSAVTFAAGGSNQGVNLTPTGTGQVTIAKTASGSMRLNIDHQNGTANTGIGLLENSVAKWSIASFGGGNFTFYNDALAGEAIGITGASNLLKFGAYGAGTLTTDSSGNVTATSDLRRKVPRGPFVRGLQELRQLSPILYSWREGSGMETAGTYAGFSAQDVLRVIPEAVGQGPDGYLTLQDRALIAALTNAVRELDQQNTMLSRAVVCSLIAAAGLLALVTMRR